MVRVAAPQFDLEECNNEAERAFIEALHARAEVGNWNADAWVWDDRVVVAVSMCDQTPGYNLLLRTLRVDFDGAGVWFGTDETQQFATELDPARPGVSVLSGRPVVELAAAAADTGSSARCGGRWPGTSGTARTVRGWPLACGYLPTQVRGCACVARPLRGRCRRTGSSPSASARTSKPIRPRLRRGG